MLVRFNVANFLSFNSLQEFSMIGGREISKSHHIHNAVEMKLLKFGAVFGANASGKSNLIRAMQFASSIIIEGIETVFTDLHFRLDDENFEKPSYFEFEIKIEDKYYAYGFEILLNKNELVSEWLYERTPAGDTAVFERDLTKGTIRTDLVIHQPAIKNRMDIYSEDLEEQAGVLFLNEMNRNKSELYRESSPVSSIKTVYDWFRTSLSIITSDKPAPYYSYYYNSLDLKKASRVMSALGTGITGLKLVSTSMEEAADLLSTQFANALEKDINKLILNKKKNRVDDTPGISLRVNENIFLISINDSFKPEVKTIVFEHGNRGTAFRFSEESDGTRRILDLMEVLITENRNKVYIIDEIDRSLHPQLTYKFIEIFLELSKERDTQLIVTTHESRLLDFNLLRRDEIWFVEKNENGESIIYSLEAYNERFDRVIDKAYLEGRYGGVPVFKPVFPLEEDR
jgi:AAA15 family ATPase/GTPase